MRHLGYLPILLAALSLGGGCVENDYSIPITGNFGLDNMCMVPMMATIPVTKGRYDVGLASNLGLGFTMLPRVQNLLMTRTANGVEMNSVQLIGWDVDIIADPGQPISDVLPQGVDGLTRLFIPAYGGQILPGASVIAPVDVINPNAASVLLNSRRIPAGVSTNMQPYQTLTIHLRARLTSGGQTISSNAIDFPVEVCAFCLAVKPGEIGVPGYNPGNGSLFDCPDNPVDENTLVTSCTPQQDSASTCCLKGRQVLCGNAVPHKSTM